MKKFIKRNGEIIGVSLVIISILFIGVKFMENLQETSQKKLAEISK